MTRKSLAMWLPLLFIVLGALLWKVVLGRDFTWQAIGSPSMWTVLVGAGVGAIALFAIFGMKKRPAR